MTMTEEKLKFLGLGTVVEVEDLIALKDIKYFVVVARAIGRNNDDSTLYAICLRHILSEMYLTKKKISCELLPHKLRRLFMRDTLMNWTKSY